jgi:MFS family permease
MATDWFAERELVLAIAILLNSWPIGIGLALVTLGPLAEASSWSVAFYATAAAAVVGLLLMVTLYQSPEVEEAADADGAKITALSIREVGLVSLAGVVWALYNVAVAILPGFAPSFLIGRGASIAEAGFIIGLYTWLFVASVQIGGMLAQKFGRSITIMVVGLAIFGVGFLLLPLVSSPLWVVVVMGIFGGAPAGPIVALPGQILAPKNRAPGLGLFSTWYFAVLATLLPLAGWFQDITGDAGAPLYFGGLAVLASLPFLALLRGLQHRVLTVPP